MNSIIISAYLWAKNARDSVVDALTPDSGQDLVEYAVLAGLIGVLAAITLLLIPIGDAMTGFGNTVKNCVDISADPYTCP